MVKNDRAERSGHDDEGRSGTERGSRSRATPCASSRWRPIFGPGRKQRRSSRRRAAIP